MKILSFFMFLIIMLLLHGCTSSAILATAMFATKATIDPRTIGTQIDDGTLKLRINNALLKDKKIKHNARINVITYQGKVLLVGQTLNPTLSLRAQRIASGMDGVVEVFNEVRHTQPISLGAILFDSWITSKVRWKLLNSNQIKSFNIKLTTENTEIFLLGFVSEYEGNAAADIASCVDGVTHVITAFTYTN